MIDSLDEFMHCCHFLVLTTPVFWNILGGTDEVRCYISRTSDVESSGVSMRYPTTVLGTIVMTHRRLLGSRIYVILATRMYALTSLVYVLKL